eukprot:COSAG01_NODE_1294_length_10874_cov_23.128062_3_plen_98_part_00
MPSVSLKRLLDEPPWFAVYQRMPAVWTPTAPRSLSRFGQVDKDGKPYDKRQKTGGGESTGANTAAAPTVRERPAAAKKSKGKLNHENVCLPVARAAY